eukprot:gnl/MRDRNA2_/MRDRNA2_41482_c0_seq1.p1 gnl/MRDRNA2_/MRDRNA2_41482_c0~~gnl/MRDRNA2_/MRDRNA2_41482_c0_seq1.p1  ORF type:complete len:375 (+),score=46.83 gnl/MRDRNA2_/MRDRNA2_41482_c0_seq1:72-1127(+)
MIRSAIVLLLVTVIDGRWRSSNDQNGSSGSRTLGTQAADCKVPIPRSTGKVFKGVGQAAKGIISDLSNAATGLLSIVAQSSSKVTGNAHIGGIPSRLALRARRLLVFGGPALAVGRGAMRKPPSSEALDVSLKSDGQAATSEADDQGKVAKVELRPFTVPHDGKQLSTGEESDVERRSIVVLPSETSESGGRGTAVCNVDAPPSVVWDRILDFDHGYLGKLKACKGCSVYSRSKLLQSQTEAIGVHMVLNAIVCDFNCYYMHTLDLNKSLMVWSLDKQRKSDIEGVQGQWYVESHPSKPHCSRVWYSGELALPRWFPKYLCQTICKRGAVEALTFCRRESEKAWEKKSLEL